MNTKTVKELTLDEVKDILLADAYPQASQKDLLLICSKLLGVDKITIKQSFIEKAAEKYWWSQACKGI